MVHTPSTLHPILYHPQPSIQSSISQTLYLTNPHPILYLYSSLTINGTYQWHHRFHFYSDRVYTCIGNSGNLCTLYVQVLEAMQGRWRFGDGCTSITSPNDDATSHINIEEWCLLNGPTLTALSLPALTPTLIALNVLANCKSKQCFA